MTDDEACPKCGETEWEYEHEDRGDGVVGYVHCLACGYRLAEEDTDD